MGKNISFLKNFDTETPLASKLNFHELFWHLYNKGTNGIALTDIFGQILVSNDIFDATILKPSSLISLIDYVDDFERVDIKEIEIASSTHRIKVDRIALKKSSGVSAFLWMGKANDSLKAYKDIVLLKNLYRSFINNTSEIVFRTSENDHLLFCNKNFIQRFSIKSSKKKKCCMERLFENIEDYQLIKSKVLSEERLLQQTINFKTSSGTRLVGLVNGQLHRDKNGEAAINWTVLDISQRIEYEASLKEKNQELEKLNATMEKFLYSTSHDLRSPLTSILGLVNLMRIETKDKVLNDYIEKIEISAFKLDKIIRDLMGLTKTSYQCPKTRRINFDSLLTNIISRYTAESNFKAINFAVNVKQNFPFFSDQERLEIIFDNLIRNTLHFFDENKVRSFVKVNINIYAKEALIEVLDNGIGIAKIHQTQVFNMFYKASHHSKGAGLGLYIVKESLQQLNGSITLESEIGFGSVFRITIPNGNKGRLISRKMQLTQN